MFDSNQIAPRPPTPNTGQGLSNFESAMVYRIITPTPHSEDLSRSIDYCVVY